MLFIKRHKKLFIGILFGISFGINYHVCDFIYGDLLKKWWPLRLNIYAAMFYGLLVSARIRTRGVTRAVYSFCLGMCISDIIDRVYFDIKVFTKEDVTMLVVNLIVTVIEYFIIKGKIKLGISTFAFAFYRVSIKIPYIYLYKN